MPGSHSDWRQGDFALDCGPIYVGDVPLEGEAEDERIVSLPLQSEPAGFAVIAQTCDIVREPAVVPTVAVCPLIEVDPETRMLIDRRRQPRLAILEHAPTHLAVNLIRPMSVTKGLLASWPRSTGFTSETKAIGFARAIERAYGRFAFPDAFNRALKPLADQILSKYFKPATPLGKMLRLISEFRVHAAPSWTAERVEICLYLLLEPADLLAADPDAILHQMTANVRKLYWQRPFVLAEPPVRIGTYEDFSAREYRESTSLDINDLSFAAHLTGR